MRTKKNIGDTLNHCSKWQAYVECIIQSNWIANIFSRYPSNIKHWTSSFLSNRNLLRSSKRSRTMMTLSSATNVDPVIGKLSIGLVGQTWEMHNLHWFVRSIKCARPVGFVFDSHSTLQLMISLILAREDTRTGQFVFIPQSWIYCSCLGRNQGNMNHKRPFRPKQKYTHPPKFNEREISERIKLDK